MRRPDGSGEPARNRSNGPPCGAQGVKVTAEIGEGNAAQMLLDAAKGASLLVAGSRGHGGIAGTLLGSVGQTLSQHSPCPVLIIRGVR